MNAHKKQRKSNTTISTTNETAFSRRHHYLHTTTVYLLRPPPSISSNHPPWIITEDQERRTYLHPLTLKPLPYNLPSSFDLTKLHRTAIAVSHNLGFHVDKLLVLPPDGPLRNSTVLVLYNGGYFKGCPRFSKVELSGKSPWVNVRSHFKGCPPYCFDRFDDVVVFNDQIYVIDRIGYLKLVINARTTRNISLGKNNVCVLPTGFSKYGFSWRRRFVVAGRKLYLVSRREENLFRVYKLTMTNGKVFRWDEVREFEGNYVLFMAKDYYFFMPVSSKFPGREYKNCIVFSEAAFPLYGKDCWEFKSEDEIAVFRLADDTFGKEGETSVFPKINWSPPPWIFDVSFGDNYVLPVHDLVSQSQLEWESDKNEDSDSGGKEDAKVHSDLKDPNSKDEVEQEGIECEEDSRDQEQEVMEVDSNSQHQEAVIIRCDSDSQEKEDDETSLQEDLSPFTDSVKAAISAAEEEVTITLLNMSDWNGATEKVAETSRKRKNNIESELKASTSTTKSYHKRDPQTTKFEGFDIKSDLVPTLQKIWRKYGNLIENSTMRSSDMIARALESLATMVQILEDNSAQSLSDGQIDYLVSTLSDLKCICFKVCWLSSCVDKAVQLHKSKSLVDSLKNLNQLSSEVKERRAVLLAKLDEVEQKLKEKMEKVSKLIPFNGQFRLEEPLGMGLT